jgi:6-phosphogluconolactonase
MRISLRPNGAKQPIAVEIFPSPHAVAEWAADYTHMFADERIKAAGKVSIALAGGSTPRLYHEILVLKFKDKIDWTRVHVFFSDDRAVPVTHKDSNYRMAEETLLSHVPIPSANVHRVESDDGDHVRAAKEYEQTIARVVGPEMVIDLVCLGMGEDGHTASLFPAVTNGSNKNGTAIEERAFVIPTRAPPTSHVQNRVTFSYTAIAKARSVMVLATGQAKANRLKEVLTGESELPMARVVRERIGHTLFIIDNAAATQLVEATKKS